MQDYNEYEDTDEVFSLSDIQDKTREEHLKELFEIERQIKELNRQKVSKLCNIAQEGKSDKVYDSVRKVHKGILESSGTESVYDILSSALNTEEELNFLLDNRNNRFYNSSDIFDEFKDHPEQKSLVKKKHLNKRGIKRQKTPSQHISYVKDAKDTQSRFLRLELELLSMKEKISIQDTRLQAVEIKQVLTEDKLDKVDIDLSCLATELSSKVDDVRKITAYIMYKEKKVSTALISKTMNIPTRTLQRWIKELSELDNE